MSSINYGSMREVTGVVFVLFTLILATNNYMFCSASSGSCIESERQALLRFKENIKDYPSNGLVTWVGQDCCNWAGIICNNITGHVEKLLLNSSMLSGKINPSVLDLKHLTHLDLSMNYFGGTQIPEFLGSLRSLKHLDLFDSGFGGMIPPQLGNLTNLLYFDLSFNFVLYAKDLQWLSQLSSLQYLDMTSTNLSLSSDWQEVANTLLSLVELRLPNCFLPYADPAIDHVNLSFLANLDLSDNSFPVIPTWIFKLRNLASLDLSYNDISGPIPEAIQNLTSLKNLHLSSLSFNSSIPISLYRLNNLKVLDLEDNFLSGTISSNIKNLTSISSLKLTHNNFEGKLPISMGELCKLRELDLSRNKWNQEMFQVLQSLSGCVSNSLEKLSLSSGQFFGHLTEQIGQFESLTHLYLDNNSISGPLPVSLSKLSSLTNLDLSSNHLKGIVSEAHFVNMTSLSSFHASGNPLMTLKVSPDWIPPFKLEYLDLGSCHLGPQFPLWFHSQETLSYLDISNTGLSCVLPSWFGNFSSQFYYLNLSRNEMHGNIPDLSKPGFYSSAVDLSSNRFEGSLPCISSKMVRLDLSNNQLSGSIASFLCNNKSEPMSLESIHLQKNQLAGKLPEYCWTRWKHLAVISLSDNRFAGTLPSSMRSLIALQSLHLHNNSFSGNFPLVLQNFAQLFTLDIGENKFRGRIPSWIGTKLLKLRILNIRANEIYGHIPGELCALSSLQILDLARNNLSGPIPKCFNNFSAMTRTSPNEYVLHRDNSLGEQMTEDALLVVKGNMAEYDKILPFVTIIDLSSNFLSGSIPTEITSLSGLLSLNLSRNLLRGVIPAKIGNMSALESIDFSMNQISGEIPPAMSSLTFLSYLNLSYNNLRGVIPKGTQLQSFDASSYVGNHLCGPPLTKSCNSIGVIPSVENLNGKKHGLEVDWLYVSLVLGFVVGFWGVIGPLLLSRSWRFFYFRFLDNMWYKLYDGYCGR